MCIGERCNTGFVVGVFLGFDDLGTGAQQRLSAYAAFNLAAALAGIQRKCLGFVINCGGHGWYLLRHIHPD